MLVAGVVLAVGTAAPAFAQGDVIAERRAGFRMLGQTMEAFTQAVNQRGDTRALAPRVDQMTAFINSLPNRVPAASLTPPQPQGTNEGQTRALAAIDADRATFATRASAAAAAFATLKTAAEAGTVTADTLRTVGGTCGACHQPFRAR
ncbi:cytochrome c [Roseomonas stagni]|uniref:Cytochrome c n=1 Tax=Falsiroseomonas algicola TaxID=2716930 RepID=A0A6M1LLT5_9PROT|nr:cytochrome c [Falsiroseomonas algicola]NGM21308.1 cytochrome c [Falsiroseomonas algicola]